MLPNSMTGVMDTGAYGGLHSSYAQQNVPPPQPTSLYHPYQQQAQAPQRLAQNRSDVLQAMRKHRSLDSAQFLQEFDSLGAPTATSAYPQMTANPGVSSSSRNYGYTSAAGASQYADSYLLTTADGGVGGSYIDQYGGIRGVPGYSTSTAAPSSYPGSAFNTPRYTTAPTVPLTIGGRTTRMEPETEMLKREVADTTEKLNYVMNSIRDFWSPELKKERQQRKDESLRMTALQSKISQQSAEIQAIRNELARREKDIGQLLSETDLADMEEELRRLRKQLHDTPRDYTDKTLSLHEMQTLKMKMERSELALAEKVQALQNSEVRLRCAEEQNAELQKRLEILSRSNLVNESQVKMVNEDVNVLRGKLETKNQLLESKERSIKKLENEVENLKTQLQESSHKYQESEHKIAQLNHRLDQMETIRRDRDAEVDRLKRRLMQQPGTRVETEMQQRIENTEHDKRKLQETIDALTKDAEMDKAQQRKAFEDETRQMRATIDYLQKELSDRHILLASQNEKISQLDLQAKKALGDKGLEKASDEQMENMRREMEESQKTVDRLLRIVHELKKEKSGLPTDPTLDRPSSASAVEVNHTGSIDLKNESNSLKIRIQQLEEALRESVGITSERDKQIAEQKQLLQQLNTQIAELYKDAPGQRDQRVMQEAAKAEALHKQLTETRERLQRQMLNLRKEAVMAVIREKEACILLLQGPPDTINEKVEILARQKEQLKHRLLTQEDGLFSTGEGGPYLANTWLSTGTAQPTDLSTSLFQQQFTGGGIPANQTMPTLANMPPTVSYAAGGISGFGGGIAPLGVSIPSTGLGVISAPASFTYGTRDDIGEDDGIWA